jgi:RNA-directed DNA polymerase
MAERTDSRPGNSGRNPRVTGTGASSVTARRGNSRPGEGDLMGVVVESGNVMAAYRRMVGNKGSAGVDGMSVAELKPYLVGNWRRIRC